MLQVLHRFLDRLRGASRTDDRVHVLVERALFRRPGLASRMAAELMSPAQTSGMFLTAPRRTGKSTFIRHDLVPALEREHRALVLYADLWDRREEDPGAVIVEVIGQALKAQEDRSGRAIRRLSLSRLKAPGVELEVARPREERQPSLRESLERLSDLAGKTVVLVIDEVQHTQATSLGREALYMLKAARDHLNACDKLKFRLLATGSHNEKIECLVSDKHQAFLGAHLEAMPTLGGADYLRWERGLHGPGFTASLEALEQAFEICLRRPAAFHRACRAAASEQRLEREAQDRLLLRRASELIDAEERQLFVRLQALGPLEQAVLRLLAEDGRDFTPLFPPAKERLKDMLTVLPHDERPDVSTTSIRAALDQLCEARLVWRGDGPYALEESQFASWLLERQPIDPVSTLLNAALRAPAIDAA